MLTFIVRALLCKQLFHFNFQSLHVVEAAVIGGIRVHMCIHICCMSPFCIVHNQSKIPASVAKVLLFFARTCDEYARNLLRGTLHDRSSVPNLRADAEREHSIIKPKHVSSPQSDPRQIAEELATPPCNARPARSLSICVLYSIIYLAYFMGCTGLLARPNVRTPHTHSTYALAYFGCSACRNI